MVRLVALAVVIGVGVVNLYWAVTAWTLSDSAAYWQAALRLRDGADLYPLLANVDASEVFRYAPWFAWLAVPFTFLPEQVAAVVWSVLLLAASGAALVPLVRRRAWLAVAFFAPILIGISAVGNVQPLMIAPLVWGVERRSGPLWVALAASLKIFPILLAVVYAGRREWRRMGATLALTALLWAPALAYGLENYPVEAGQAASLIAVPVLWAAVVGAGTLVTLWLARGRFGWVAAATSVVLAVPRLFVYDVTYLLVGAASTDGGRRSARTSRHIHDWPRASRCGCAAPPDREGTRLDRRWICHPPLALGLVARLLPLFAPLPFGSGGLFAVMTDELRSGGWPMTTAYNNSGIPFAYPPLGLLVLAALPGEVLDLMRFVPLP